MGRIMAWVNRYAERGQVGRAGRIGIAPGECDPPPVRDQRQCAHTGPADSQEVDRAWISGVEQVHGDWSQCKLSLRVLKVDRSVDQRQQI
jgi:hypothetical protein